MRLRYDGTCRVCGTMLPATTEAIYERVTKAVRCLTHDDPRPSSPPRNGSGPQPAASSEAAVT